MSRSGLRHHAVVLAVLCLGTGYAAGLACAQQAAAPTGADPHAAHRQMMAAAADSAVRRTTVSYDVPHLSMVRADGERVFLDSELNDGRPVVLNFIFTTCTTICPMTSQVFSMLQHKLGADSSRVHMVSISIDPEQDTPARLRAYAARFGAGASWQHYTGTVQASAEAQRAFGVYQGDKANHQPVTLLRAAGSDQWIRLDGFATADDMLGELRSQVASAR